MHARKVPKPYYSVTTRKVGNVPYRTIFQLLEDFTHPHMEGAEHKVCTIPGEQTDLSFPVPYVDQAKFLTLADKFLALKSEPRDSNVIPIEGDRLPPAKTKRTA
jgi:hypothetical protein